MSDERAEAPEMYPVIEEHSPAPRGRTIVAIIVGAILALIGLTLLGGGAWLAVLGGSLYYLLAGAGLLFAGVQLIRGRLIGGWVYVAIVALTFIWAWWEVGADPWGQVPRIIAPVVLMLLVLPAMATLSTRDGRWQFALGGVAAVLVLTLVNFWVASANAPATLFAQIPAPTASAMGETGPMKVGADWPVYGGTASARRYSPLQQINAENVGSLKRAWVAHTGDLPKTAFAEGKYGAETTPIKVGDTLYLCSATNILIALDPTTGKEKWRYDPQVPDAWIPYTAACRGVVYYDTRIGNGGSAPQSPANRPAAPANDCVTRIIEGTLDGRVIAVDATTGKPCSGFGTNGQVDIKKGMGEVVPGMVAISAPPTIVDGVIVVGHQVLDGQKLEAPSGVIHGYDAVTGELRWAWDMMNPDWTGLPPEGQTFARGTPNMWTTASGDDQLGLVYLPMGNASVDYWSTDRKPREKFFASSLVAVDVKTGKPRWRFQTSRNDVWDYDLGAQATLIDWPTGNGTEPALILPSKQGDLYVLDRRTGRPLTQVGELKAPQGGVEPDQRAATQPVSLWHTLRKPDLTERDMWGMSPIDQMVCRIQFRRASYEGFYTAPTADRRWIEYPGYNGGTDWGGIAVDPARGVIIANYNDMPNYNRLVPRAEADAKGWKPRAPGDAAKADAAAERGGNMGGHAEGAGDPQAGAPYAIDVNAGWRLPFTGLLCKEPPYGGIRAIDMRTGKTLWDRPLGTARKNGPFGIPSYLPISIGTPNNGGSVVTAGGLIFVAAATDDLIRAIDIRTGKTVWQDVLPAGGQATPMTYEVDGRQYLVIMAGGHHFMETPIGDSLVAYALPQ